MKTNQSGSLRNRKTSGFTMAEMLIAVAILVILMAVSFIAVINHQRTLKQHELDGTAREIFIAAQNHLTMAQSQGLLKDAYAQSARSVDDSNVADATGSKDGTNGAIRYWYVGKESNEPDKNMLTDPSKRPNTLYEMLPFGSIDDTVRLGGSYVIRYDLESARVLDVFYSDLQRLSEHAFSSDDYGTLFPGLVGEEKKSDRLNAFGGQVIGWYGGDDLDRNEYPTLFAPTLKITNAERLTVTATFDFGSYSKNSAVTNAEMRIVMRGDKSKVEKEVGDSVKMTDITREYSVTRVLDDITVAGGQFKTKWCSDSDTTKNLIPGENVSIYAVVYTNSALASIAKSSTKHTNSLFANMVNEKNADGSVGDLIGTISNIRHLENLDASISGYDLDTLGADGTTKFKQVSDLRWKADGAKKPIAFTSAIVAGTTTPASDVKIYRLSDNTADTARPYFASVTPCKAKGSGTENYALDYDGNGKKISNVEINSTGDAGIFATLPSGSTVKSLELVDCSVETTGGSAGTLVGSGVGTLTIKDVMVHDSGGSVKSKVKSNAGTAAADPNNGWLENTYGYVSGGLAGQLVGIGSPGVSVDGCGASVLVEATGNGCAAGGLVGHCSGGLTSYVPGMVTVTNSYAGGHTKEGTGQYDNQRFNVAATSGTHTSAGGLVGATLLNVTLEHCYATTSVSSATYAGGLAGSAQGAGVISGCYATGLIDSNVTSGGAFMGHADDSVTIATSHYYEIINGDLKPIGNKELTQTAGVTPLDKDAKSFNDFYSANRKNEDGTSKNVDKAIPYDSALVTHYNGIYPLQTIKMLNPSATGVWTTSHYGDWPIAETLVVNTKN